MNVFILCTGRCGSVTFIKACKHITNYTAAHESRAGMLGQQRVNYPDNHIEADNRLTWFLGRLDEAYSDNAMYIHLHRDKHATARSFSKRFGHGSIIDAYRANILQNAEYSYSPEELSKDYCTTVEENIRMFLKDKSRTMDFELESASNCFSTFWELIGAEGNREMALSEWDQHYNASESDQTKGKADATIGTFLKKTGGKLCEY